MAEKRVLIITEVFFPEIGSGANRINNIVMLLKKKGYKVDVLTSNPSYPNKEIYEDKSFWDEEKMKILYNDSTIYRVKECNVKRTENFITRLYIYLYFMFQSLLQVFKMKTSYDIVVSTIPSIFVGVIGIVAKLKLKAKYILDIRDLWPECLKNIGVFRKNKILLKFGYILERILLFFSDAVVVNSEGFIPYLKKIGYSKRIVFVPNGVTEDELENIKNIKNQAEKEEKFTVIYTGMLGLPQNVRSIVKAANQLRRYENIHFKIIGTGIQKDKVKELIEHYQIDNVSLYDPMPKEDVIKEISKADVAIAHLRGDSAFDLVIPGKMIDYMSIGIPIIAGVEGYTAEVLEKSKAGIVITPDDYGNMADKIKLLYRDKELCKEYADNGYKYCKETFLWQKNIVKIVSLIEELGGANEKEGMYVCVESLHK